MSSNPNEGNRFNDPMNEDEHTSIIENIYWFTGNGEDYINPTKNVELSWRSVCI
jgi:hypothetical protein